MTFDIGAFKSQARNTLHATMSVAATYWDDETEPTDITVRWHNRLRLNGAAGGEFDVSILEGIDRLVFNDPELTSKGIVLDEDSGYVRIPAYGNALFKVGAMEPSDGPVNIYHRVEHRNDAS